MVNPISNFFDKVVSNRVNEAVQVELAKKERGDIVFSGLTASAGFRRDKPQDKHTPKGVGFHTLRAFADFYPIARSCINHRKSQVAQLAWDITPIVDEQIAGEQKISPEQRAEILKVKEAFKFPTGSRTKTFRHFVSQILEDILVIDALALYKRKNRGDGIIGYLPVDGSTIKLKIHQDGTTPLPPEVAYVQVVRGKEVAKLTTDEMIYKVMNPKTTTPYGFSALESLIVTVTTALKLQSTNLAYVTEGNVPEGLVALPKEIAADQKAISKWQRIWDSMMAGDPRATSRMRFLPEGMEYTPTKKQTDMAFERFEQWLLQTTCAMFSVQPQDIGFTMQINKATAEVQWEVGKERGLFPLALYLKEIFDEIIQVDLGHADLEFSWTNLNPTNAKEEADVFKVLVDSGARSVDEWRVGEGLEPIGLGHYIKTGNGIQLVEDILAGEYKEDNNNGDDKDDNNNDNKNKDKKQIEEEKKKLEQEKKKDAKKNPEDKKKEADNKANKVQADGVLKQIRSLANTPAMMKDLKKWKKAATHDFERGRPFRDFQSNSIDDRTRSLIKDGLKKAKTEQDISQLFEPFLSPESRVINAVLDLYEDVGQLLPN